MPKPPASNSLLDPSAILALSGRIAIASLFIPSGFGKLAASDATIGYIANAGLPFAPLGLAIAVVVEIGFSALLVLGLFTRPIAAVMAAFTFATGVFFHAQFADQMQFIHFFKNVAISGGLLQIAAFGAGRFSVDGWRVGRQPINAATQS